MPYLLAIALGPVQDFIAAARRTADLTAGSELLSQIASEVARFLEEQHNAKLIYPARANQPSAPNRILCLVETDKPHKVVQEAHKRAVQFLHQRWQEVESEITRWIRGLSDISDVGDILDTDLVQHQLNNFLEFYAARVPFGNGKKYKDARRDVEALLAGRKALRDFKQARVNQNRPKSPLDPAYDSVFKGTRLPSSLVNKRPFYLKPSETLDAISLIKRYRGYAETRDREKVPSTTEMAFRALENFLRIEATAAIRELENVARELDVSELSELIHQARWRELQEEDRYKDHSPKKQEELRESVETAASEVRGVLRREDIPEEFLSYYAILVADGDRMGQFLDSLDTVEQHRQFSLTLSEFADDARDIVEHRYKGHLVYAGGDDVLAMLPADRAIACARQLACQFNLRMEQFRTQCARENIPLQFLPTLSAGVAIMHALEHLRDALDWARRAERAAKRAGRNRLAVAYYPRSGEAITVDLPWHECQTLARWVHAFRRGLAMGLPYELLQLAREYEQLGKPQQQAIIAAEAQRVIQRKEGHQYAPELPEWLNSACALRQLAHLMIIARMLALYPEVQV